jgi:hypothetical protein
MPGSPVPKEKMFNFQPFPPEDAVPPQDVRFTELRVEPWEDGRRVRVHINVTPFQQRPNLEARIVDAAGNEIASTSIVELLENKIVFTMHLRGKVNNPFTLFADLSYAENGEVDRGQVSFETHPQEPNE